MAFADPLGEALWRLKFSNERAQWPIALARLSNRCKGIVHSRDIRRRLCSVALREWLDDNCHACGGRKFLMATDQTPLRVCAVCGGTGVRRYEDEWRMQQMGFTPEVYRKWERRFGQVHDKIVAADARAWRDVAVQLGRIAGPAAERKTLEFSRKRFILSSVTGAGPIRKPMPAYAVSSATGA
jgi:hypothetical protein